MSERDASQPEPKPDNQMVTETSAPVQAKSRLRSWLPGIAFLVLLVVAAFVVWRVFFASKSLPDNVISLSGRIEGDDSAVAPKSSGRILELRVREGDVVNAGDTIAILDDEQIGAREDQARAGVAEAESKANAARAQIGVLQEQLKQSQLETEQATVDAAGRVRQAEGEVTAAEAEVAKQEAAYRLAAFNRQAYTRLAATGAVSEQKGKEAVSTADQQGAAVAAEKRRVDSARGAVLIARRT